MTSYQALLLSTTTLLLVLLSYFYVDQDVAQWCHINLTHSDKAVFLFITQFGESTFYLIGFPLIALFFHYYWKDQTWRNKSFFMFAAVAVSGILADIIKVIAGRYRPSELFERGLYGFDFFHIDRALTSFPSGHTATAFSIATAIAYMWPKFSLIAWTCALSVGISRIAISAHYPSDVLAGGLIGILSVYLILYYWNKKTKLSL